MDSHSQDGNSWQHNLALTKHRLIGDSARALVLALCLITVITILTISQSKESLASLYGEHSTTHDMSLIVSSTSPFATTVYLLPLVFRSETDEFSRNSPIWAHSSTPDSHEVALFRHAFALDKRLKSSELYIFADTRYEVWIDGVWLGRGPARFSQTTREYDVYQLGELQSGSHLIAVLTQWAPNYRRSESVTPLLMGHIQGVSEQGFEVIARTGSQWKALLSNAWKTDAVPVHSWNLIGPTELLDLRRLPSNWMLPTFSDNEWASAVVKPLSDACYISRSMQFVNPYEKTELDSPNRVRERTGSAPTSYDITYLPRSIQFLENVSIPVTITDAGSLSPGHAVAELVPPAPDPYEFSFKALNPTVFTVEMLSEPQTSPFNNVRLDGSELAWEKSGIDRPDVLVASTLIAAGDHALSFTDIPPQGVTFSISTQHIQSDPLPFQQGVHAGRRLLLAEHVSQPDQVMVSSEDGINIEFTSPSTYAALDLGRVVHGRLVAEVMGPSGAVLDIGWAQRLWQGSRPLPYPGSLHQEWNQTDSWILDGTTRSVSTIDARAGRYILIAVWGSGSVQLENVQVYEERYPMALQGEFHSSNARLDRIWQVGVDTLYSNMTDAYTDTPWRERGQWWGDAYVEDYINRVSFGDTDLVRRGLLFMAEAFTEGRPNAMAPNGGGIHMLDYGMLWVQSLNDYWQLTEDVQLLAKVYPVLLEFIDYLASYESPITGLLDVPSGHWSQTALIDWAGHSSRCGQSTAVNALYYGTLMDTANIADDLGDSFTGKVWREKAGFVKKQINTYLYISSQDRYLSSILDEEPISPSPHAQAWALAYGLVPEDKINQVASSLLGLLSPDPSSPNVEIYGMFWVLEALGHAGRISEALAVTDRYYGRLLDLNAATWWEVFNADSLYYESLAHGWGGAPTWFLTTYVLGARRLGAETWTVRPAFWSVSHASGALPLGNDKLQVSWQAPTCEDGILELSSPSGTKGEVVIPFTSDTTAITLNGNVIWRDGMSLVDNVEKLSDGIHILSLEGGTHVLHAHQDCTALYLPIVLHEQYHTLVAVPSH